MKKHVICVACSGLLLLLSGCDSFLDKSESVKWMDRELKSQGYTSFFITYTKTNDESVYHMESLDSDIPTITYTSGEDIETYTLKLQDTASTYHIDNKNNKTTLQLEQCQLTWDHEKDIMEDSSCRADNIQAIEKDKNTYQAYFDEQQYSQADMFHYLQWYLDKNASYAKRIYKQLDECLESLGYKQREKGVFQLDKTTEINKISGKNLVFDTNDNTFGFESVDHPGWKVKLQIKDHVISINEYTYDFDTYHWISEDPGLEIEQEAIDMYRYIHNYLQTAGITDFLEVEN